jgi:hypothetical protein
MRSILLGLAFVIAASAAAMDSALAYSFFNKRYCTIGGGGRGGEPDCSYNTWEQCRASASGLGRYCSENPFWKPEGTERRRPSGRWPER